jgi:hypothetical protein
LEWIPEEQEFKKKTPVEEKILPTEVKAAEVAIARGLTKDIQFCVLLLSHS